jgi:uncharacterized RDD family membrane protein YckC
VSEQEESQEESNSQSFEASIPSLAPGNVVTVGMQLVRLHFNDYFIRSLLAHLWIALALVIGALVIGIASGLGYAIESLTRSQGLATYIGVGLGSALALLGVLFISARFTASGGAMTRMGINTLRQRYEPGELYRQTIFRRIWGYFIAALIYSVLVLLTYAILSAMGIGFLLLIQAPWQNLINQISDERTKSGLIIGATILGLLYVLLVGIAGYYVTARLWFFDAVLALETETSPIGALLRSWEVTRGRGWSVMTVMFTAGLITLPIAGLANIVGLIVPFASLIANIIFFPYGQAVKAANYYDLAATKTGLRFDLDTAPSDLRQYLRRVAIQTPEGVALDFALGGPGSRALAWIVDQIILYVLLSALLMAGAFAYAYVISPVLIDRFSDLSQKDLNLWALAIASIIGFAITHGYFIYYEACRRGQTPGKQFAKIRVVRDDGQPISFREATLRSFIGWIDMGFFAIGLLLIILNRSEKRLGDMAAGTLVIQDEKVSQHQVLTIPTRFSTLTADTVEVLKAQTDPAILSVNQYLVLRNFLGCRDQLSSRDRVQVTQRLASQARSLLMPTSPEVLGTIPDESLIEAMYVANRPAYQSL